MVIRNKEYYSQFDEEMKRAKRTLGYHVRQAERCKRIYQNTRGRFGLWGLLNRWAILTESNGLNWVRPESPYIVGMFHDICKQDQYLHPEVGHHFEDNKRVPHYDWRKWEHDSETLLKGHGDKSVMLLSQYVQLTMEEILCIRYHMGAFVDQKEWNNYTRAIHQYDTVLWTHHADMIAAHIIEKEDRRESI